MLQNRSLRADIITGRRWAELEVPSSGGRAIPISTVFPLESMRGETGQALQTIGRYYQRWRCGRRSPGIRRASTRSAAAAGDGEACKGDVLVDASQGDELFEIDRRRTCSIDLSVYLVLLIQLYRSASNA